MPEHELDFSSKIPLYKQISEILCHEIVSNGYKEHDYFYTEKDLLRRFQTSTITIKGALKDLVGKDLIYRRPKKGTFIKGIIPKNNETSTASQTKSVLFLFSGDVKEAGVNPFYSVILNAVEKEIVGHGYRLEIFTDDKTNDRGDLLRHRIREKSLSGYFLVSGEFSDNALEEIRQSEKPVVIVDSPVEWEDICSVTLDNFRAASIAAGFLVERGHKEIAYLGGGENKASDERKEGLIQTMKQAGIHIRDELMLVGEKFEYESGFSSMRKLLESKGPGPTAVFAANDSIAIGAMRAALERGMRIPEDISIMGFDDIDMARHMYPRLTTMHVDRESMGKTAARMMIAQMEGLPIPERNLKFLPSLVIRESVR